MSQVSLSLHSQPVFMEAGPCTKQQLNISNRCIVLVFDSCTGTEHSYVFIPNTDQEPRTSSAYICQFRNLEVTVCLMDELMKVSHH